MSAAASVGPGFGRLVRVELRKMYDTRAGFCLLLLNVAVMALAAGLSTFTGARAERTFGSALGNAGGAADFLLPIVGILLVTSEWSQRTAQITFALVPRRGRVLAAKIAASATLGLAAFAVAVALSAIATLAGGKPPAPWALDGLVLPQCALYAVVSVVAGTALGAAILRSAPAIVASFLLPIAVVALTTAIDALRPVGAWVDQDALSRLPDHVLHGQEWGRVATNVLLWLALPLAIGLVRFVRSDVR